MTSIDAINQVFFQYGINILKKNRKKNLVFHFGDFLKSVDVILEKKMICLYVAKEVKKYLSFWLDAPFPSYRHIFILAIFWKNFVLYCRHFILYNLIWGEKMIIFAIGLTVSELQAYFHFSDFFILAIYLKNFVPYTYMGRTTVQNHFET